MRETLISARGSAPQEAADDTTDVVAHYRHRLARRRALLVPAPARPTRDPHPGAPAHPAGRVQQDRV